MLIERRNRWVSKTPNELNEAKIARGVMDRKTGSAMDARLWRYCKLGMIEENMAPCLELKMKREDRISMENDTLRQVDELKRQVRVAGEDVDLDPKFNMVLQVIVGRKLD